MLLVFATQYFFLILIPFYFYCYILRMTAKEWITEMRARNNLVLQKIEKENKESELEDWIVMR